MKKFFLKFIAFSAIFLFMMLAFVWRAYGNFCYQLPDHGNSYTPAQRIERFIEDLTE